MSEDPALLVEQMWVHSSQMDKEFSASGRPWTKISARDLNDLSAFARNGRTDIVPGQAFSLPPAGEGKEEFTKYCAPCHPTSNSWEMNLKEKSWMEIGAALWNHAPLMGGHPQLPAGSMKLILAWVWDLQHRDAPANPARGAALFVSKKCVSCHADAVGKPVSPRPAAGFSSVYSMAAVGWGPARLMHAGMKEKKIRWPWLAPQEIVDLAAYLDSLQATR